MTAKDKFIKDLIKRGGHVLQEICTYNGKKMLYYREYGDFATSTQTKVF